MLAALFAAFLLIVPPSALWTLGHLALVPLYYGVVNVWFGYLFWRHRRARMTVVMSYLLSGMFLFKFLIDPLQVSALPPLPAPPPQALAGSPRDQAAVGTEKGSRWTDWMKAEHARLPARDAKGAATDRGPLKIW